MASDSKLSGRERARTISHRYQRNDKYDGRWVQPGVDTFRASGSRTQHFVDITPHVNV